MMERPIVYISNGLTVRDLGGVKRRSRLFQKMASPQL